VHLDKNIKLLDSPGIVFGTGTSDNDVILRNAVRIEQIPDPIAPVEAILKRCKKEQLLESYKIPNFKDTPEFLLHIAQKRGKLAKVISFSFLFFWLMFCFCGNCFKGRKS
jgi:nuclear GTP-binding protein